MKMNRKSFLQLLAGLLSTTTAINKSQAEAWKPIIVEPLIDPQLPPEPLLSWLAQPRISILQSEDPFIGWLIAATFTRQKIEFIYNGGSTPGQWERPPPPLRSHTLRDGQARTLRHQY